MQFWADVVEKDPGLVADLPSDATAMLWGYDEAPLRDAARAVPGAWPETTYVCPGTCGWSSIGGRIAAARGNPPRWYL
jgi:hypothetical protein